MRSFLGCPQLVATPPFNYLNAVIYKTLQSGQQVKHLWLLIDNGHHVHAKTSLHWRKLIKIL